MLQTHSEGSWAQVCARTETGRSSWRTELLCVFVPVTGAAFGTVPSRLSSRPPLSRGPLGSVTSWGSPSLVCVLDASEPCRPGERLQV